MIVKVCVLFTPDGLVYVATAALPDTVQMSGVLELNDTANPEVAVALSVSVPPTV